MTMRPPGSLPRTLDKSMPNSRATRRTDGDGHRRGGRNWFLLVLLLVLDHFRFTALPVRRRVWLPAQARRLGCRLRSKKSGVGPR